MKTRRYAARRYRRVTGAQARHAYQSVLPTSPAAARHVQVAERRCRRGREGSVRSAAVWAGSVA